MASLVTIPHRRGYTPDVYLLALHRLSLQLMVLQIPPIAKWPIPTVHVKGDIDPRHFGKGQQRAARMEYISWEVCTNELIWHEIPHAGCTMAGTAPIKDIARYSHGPLIALGRGDTCAVSSGIMCIYNTNTENGVRLAMKCKYCSACATPLDHLTPSSVTAEDCTNLCLN